MTRKDLVSWVVKNKSLTRETTLCLKLLFPLAIFFNENNITKLVVDNALSEGIVETAATGS